MNESLIFDDILVEKIIKKYNSKDNGVVLFDYSPKIGQITKINQLIRFRLITELSLIGHGIEDITNLSGLVNLKKLNLSWNSIKSIVCLMKLPQIEFLHVGHNQIQEIPKTISALNNLKNFQISNNPISDRGNLYSLRQNLNLICLDIESTPVSCSSDSILFCIYIMPQLMVINRTKVEPKMRRDANRRFGRIEIDELAQTNVSLMNENKKFRKIIRSFQSNDEGTARSREIDKLKQEKSKLIQYIKNQDQIIEKLQNNQNTHDNPLSSVVKDLQEKIHRIQDQLAQTTKENKILSYRVQENESMQKEYKELKLKSSQFMEKVSKLTQDNQQLTQINIKLYDQIGELKQEQSNIMSQQNLNNMNSNMFQSNELIQQNNILNNQIEILQKDKQQLAEKITNLSANIKNQDGSLKELQKQLSLKNELIENQEKQIESIKQENLNLLKAKKNDEELEKKKEKLEIQNKEKSNNEKVLKSLFQALSIEIENQRKYYSISLSKPIANTFEEQTFLACTQTFKQVQIQYDTLKESINNIKTKKKTLKNTIESLNSEQKTNTEIIQSLRNNIDSLNRELFSSKEMLANSVPKDEYMKIKTEFANLQSENEKNHTTLKRVVSQLSQQKRAKNDLIQTKSATDEENAELMKRIETLSNELKQKRDKVEEYRFEASKHERKVLNLKEIINKMTIEKNQMSAQIEQFIIFREEVTNTIAKLEERENAKENKLRERIKSCEAEKNNLQIQIQKLSSKIHDLNQENLSFLDSKKEFKFKMQQKDNDLHDIETENERLKNELNDLKNAFSSQKEENEQLQKSLKEQIRTIQNDKDQLINEKTNELNDIRNQLEDSIRREQKNQQKEKKLKNFIMKVQNENGIMNEENEKLKNQIEELIDREKQALENQMKLKELNNTNEHLFKTLTQKYQILQQEHEDLGKICSDNDTVKQKLKYKIKKLKEHVIDLQSEVDKTKQENEELDNQLVEKSQYINTVKVELDEVQSKLNENDDTTAQIKQENLDLQNRITEQAIEYDNLKMKLATIEKTTVPKETYQSALEKGKEINEKFTELNAINEENIKKIEQLNDENTSISQSLAVLQKKYKDTLNQMESNEEMNKKTTEIQQQTIEALKQQLTEAQGTIEQKSNQEQLNEKQKMNEISQLKAELLQIQSHFSATKSDLEIKTNENAQLKNQNQKLRKELEEIQQRNTQNETNLTVLTKKYETEKTQRIEENDENLQQISSAKARIKELEQQSYSLQNQIQDLLEQNREKVPKQKYEDLHQKYTSLKKLHQFESNKNKSSIIQKEEQLEQLTIQFHEKEENLNETIEKLSHELEEKKELIKRLQRQIQQDNTEIEELKPLLALKTELIKVQNMLKLKDNEISSLKGQTETLAKQKKQNESIIEDFRSKSEKVYSSLHQIPLIIHSSSTNTSMLEQIIDEMNPILKMYSIDEINGSFRHVYKVNDNPSISIAPTGETLLEKHKKLIERVAQALMSLPIGKPSFNIESNEQLESQLEKLQKLVELVKKIFDDREKNIENLAAMVDSQHQAVLKISEVPTDSSAVALSFQNYQKAQKIINEDRSRRSVMSKTSLMPRKF